MKLSDRDVTLLARALGIARKLEVEKVNKGVTHGVALAEFEALEKRFRTEEDRRDALEERDASLKRAQLPPADEPLKREAFSSWWHRLNLALGDRGATEASHGEARDLYDCFTRLEPSEAAAKLVLYRLGCSHDAREFFEARKRVAASRTGHEA